MDRAVSVAVACRWLDGVGGTTTSILERTRRFARLGWDIHLFGERLDLERIREAGGVPHRLPGWPWGSHLKRRLFAWAFGRAARGDAFDLIEGHGDALEQDALMLHNCVHAAHEAIYGAPLPESSGAGRLHARILRENRFRQLIANSELMKREVAGRFGVPAAKIAVVYPGFDPRRFCPADRAALGGPLRRELGVGENDVLVGLITSGDFQKRGVDVFIRSLARLSPETRGRTHGLVAGKEKRVEEFRRLAREAGLGPRIHFLEATPQVERCHHALDVFFYPARYEEFGQSVQEALACGVPVLAGARVGALELLGELGRSMFSESYGEEAFARRLEELIARPDLRRARGLGGAAAVKENTWDRNFQRTLDLYEEILSSEASQ